MHIRIKYLQLWHATFHNEWEAVISNLTWHWCNAQCLCIAGEQFGPNIHNIFEKQDLCIDKYWSIVDKKTSSAIRPVRTKEYKHSAPPQNCSRADVIVAQREMSLMCFLNLLACLGNIDGVVALSFEFFKRHFARSKVFPDFTQTYRPLECSHLLFLCFVHLYHNLD